MTSSLQPDFGPAPQGSPLRHRHFARIPALLGGDEFRVLEVGSWTGESALVWARAIRRGAITCVDPWEPYASVADIASANPIYVKMDQMLHSEEALKLFRHNIRLGSPGVSIYYKRCRLSEFLGLNNFYDIVYIDGSHYYEDVRTDLEIAKRLVRRGGVICGDDLELQADQIDFKHARTCARRDYVIEPKTGREFHPGVTLAVWEAFGGLVWSADGFWAMRRHDMLFEQPKL